MKRWVATEADHPTLAKLWDAHVRAVGVWQALSPVERDVCRLIAVGRRETAICAALGGWSASTLNTTKQRIARKMDLAPDAPINREICKLYVLVDAAA